MHTTRKPHPSIYTAPGTPPFNQAKLEAHHGVCYLQLGRPADAVPVLTKALDTLDPALKKHRSTALAGHVRASGV